jgi:tetratricopeptide (TPR) repeat protein
MARVFYSTQQFDTSIKYYEKLDQAAPDWTTSLFEASWAYFMKTNNSKALGNIHSLNSPFFEDEFYPESVLLRAVIYFNYCLYDRAMEAIQEFEAKYKPLTKNLRDLMEKYDDNAEFYEYIKKVIAGKAGLDDKTQRLVMSVLTDKTIKKEFAWVDELQKESDALAASDKAWQTTAVAADVNAELTVQKSLADGQAGKVARDRVERLVRELGALGRDGRKIQFEILNAMADKVSAESLKTRISTDHKEEPIVVDDEHFVWKFNGEYWKDELGYYRFKVRNQCPKN